MDVVIEGPTHATRYWHRLDDGSVQCDLCPRFCKLRKGQLTRAREVAMASGVRYAYTGNIHDELGSSGGQGITVSASAARGLRPSAAVERLRVKVERRYRRGK